MPHGSVQRGRNLGQKRHTNDYAYSHVVIFPPNVPRSSYWNNILLVVWDRLETGTLCQCQRRNRGTLSLPSNEFQCVFKPILRNFTSGSITCGPRPRKAPNSFPLSRSLFDFSLNRENFCIPLGLPLLRTLKEGTFRSK